MRSHDALTNSVPALQAENVYEHSLIACLFLQSFCFERCESWPRTAVMVMLDLLAWLLAAVIFFL